MRSTHSTSAPRPRKPQGRDIAMVLGMMLLALTVMVTGSQGFFKAHAATLIPTASTSYPYVVITSPTTGATDGNTNWTVTTATVDPNSTITQVALYNGTTLVATDTATPYTFTISVNMGANTITAVATDATGATGVSLPVVINRVLLATPTSLPTPNSISWVSPANGATFTAPANIVLSVNIGPANTPDENYINQVQYYSGTTLIGTDTAPKQNTSPDSTFTWTNVPAGTYVLVAIALNYIDGGGKTTSPISITVAPPATGTPTTGTTATSTPPPGAKCSVSYAITSQWSGGFGASVTITNTGTTTINGWSLVWTFANGQTITQIWNASETTSGGTVTVTNLSYDNTIAPNTTVNFGFNGSWSGSNTKPTSFTLNGQACSS